MSVESTRHSPKVEIMEETKTSKSEAIPRDCSPEQFRRIMNKFESNMRAKGKGVGLKKNIHLPRQECEPDDVDEKEATAAKQKKAIKANQSVISFLMSICQDNPMARICVKNSCTTEWEHGLA